MEIILKIQQNKNIKHETEVMKNSTEMLHTFAE